MKILGIHVDNVSREEALSKVSEFLLSDKQYKIFTPNPEMLVDAQKDDYFMKVLNDGDLNLCDGRGIQLVSKEKIERIPGTDFMLDICVLAEQKKCSVYFLGSGSREVVLRAGANIQSRFPQLKICGFHEGPEIKRSKDQKIIVDEVEQDKIVDDIIQKAPDILFVAFGHVKQEKWIHENLKDLPSVKVGMGVGGAFDYISGTKKRAPQWMRRLGMEWLYRVLYEPKRIMRIWRAVVIFLFLNFFKKSH